MNSFEVTIYWCLTHYNNGAIEITRLEEAQTPFDLTPAIHKDRRLAKKLSFVTCWPVLSPQSKIWTIPNRSKVSSQSELNRTLKQNFRVLIYFTAIKCYETENTILPLQSITTLNDWVRFTMRRAPGVLPQIYFLCCKLILKPSVSLQHACNTRHPLKG